MTEREKKFLSDIVNSIDLIESFLAEDFTFDRYTNDFKTKGAVERHLGIIGEATNKFLKESEGNILLNARQIINLRNRLVHSYDNVDDSIIWSIATRHLAELRRKIV